VTSEGTHPAWRSWVEALVVLSAAVLVLSGALATIHVRPYGHRAPGHLGLALAAVAALRVAHGVSAGILVASALTVAVLRRPWSRPRAPAAGFAMLAAFVLTGLATPWDSLLPWSPPLGANMARPMPLLGHDGPFPELVEVNVKYDDTVRAIGRLRLGPRGVGRLYLAHAVVLPVGAVAALVIVARRRSGALLRRRA
jgi:hypothetical protein